MSHLSPSDLCSLFGATPQPLVVTSSEDQIVYMNRSAEEMFGYNHGELVGSTWQTLVPEPTLGRRKNGADFHIEVRSVPVQTESGLKLMAVTESLENVSATDTEQRGYKSELEEF